MIHTRKIASKLPATWYRCKRTRTRAGNARITHAVHHVTSKTWTPRLSAPRDGRSVRGDLASLNDMRYLRPNGNLGVRKQKPSDNKRCATNWAQHTKLAQRACGWKDAHSVNNTAKQGYARNQDACAVVSCTSQWSRP